MQIRFNLNIDTTCYFDTVATIKIKGTGTITIWDGDYNNIPENLDKSEFIDYLFDIYLLDMGYDEDNITLNQEDINESYQEYLKAQNESY